MYRYINIYWKIYTYCKYTHIYIYICTGLDEDWTCLLNLTKGLRISCFRYMCNAFPQSFHDSNPIHDSATVFWLAVTIQEVSSWHPGHAESKHFPIFGIFLLFVVTARHLKKPKKQLPFRCLWVVFLFLCFYSLTLSLSLSVVLESTYLHVPWISFPSRTVFCAKKTFAFWVHGFLVETFLPKNHGISKLGVFGDP